MWVMMIIFIILALIVIPIWAIKRTYTLEKKFDEKISDINALIGAMEERILRLRRAVAGTEEKKQDKEEKKKEPAVKAAEGSAPQKQKPVDYDLERKKIMDEVKDIREKKAEPLSAPSTPEWFKKIKRFVKTVDWEQFTGVKLFAWLGGIALFCGAAFFIKYSIDKNLISPAFRLALGSAAGIGLVVWSLFIDRKKYKVTSHILAAGGIGLLYIVVFAATNMFHFLPSLAGFILLALVSTSCFVLAIFLDGAAISALGALGAYAVPVLVSTGDSNLITLFIYLAIVNAGLFEVVRRLKSSGLFLLSALGTVVILAMGISSVGLAKSADVVTGVAMANLALFTAFLIFVPGKMSSENYIKISGYVIFISALALMTGLLSINGPHSAILAIFAAALAVGLIYVRQEWSKSFVFFLVLTFVIMMLWVFNGFNPKKNPLEFGLFFIYGLVAGLGPILLIHKHGASDFGMKWFRVFPLSAVFMTLFILVKSPDASGFFWPMAIGLHLICMFLYFIIGSVAGLTAITVLTVINGVLWVNHGSPSMGVAFYILFLAAGLFLCAAAFAIYSYLPALMSSPNLKAFRQKFNIFDEKTAEWMAATPVIGAFVILGAVFLSQSSIQPHPGMATGLFFLVVAVFLGKRIESAPLIITALMAFGLAQSCWMLKVNPESGMKIGMLVWSAVLWLGSLAASFFVFRPANKNTREWQAWAVFELIQSLFLIKASSMLLQREFVGWSAVALFVIKLPEIIYLLKQLEAKKERNEIIAFQGGIFLFYLSCIPVLVMQKEWLGLALVFESTALLWLNRRIEHPGLPVISALLSAAGLVMITGNLNVLEPADSMPVFNMAVLSLVLATASLGYSAKIAPESGSKKAGISFASYFQWIAIGMGFFLANYLVADWFGTQQNAGRFNFHFLFRDNLFQYASYSLLWLIFGALLWRAKTLSKWLRYAGLAIIITGWVRIILWPYFFHHSLTLENPLLNPGLLIYVPAIAILAYLAIRQKEDEWKINMHKVFIAMFVVACLMALSQEGAALLQPGTKYGFFFGHNMPMSFASGFSWFLYGAGLFLWPWKLAKPFRIFGVVLMIVGLIKTAWLPYIYRDAFGGLPAVLNIPNLMYLFYIGTLVFVTLRDHGDKWPFEAPFASRRCWGWALGLFVFYVINVEVVKLFGEQGVSFTMATSGKFSQQLAYSFGWLIYAMLMLAVGIQWKAPRARWAALALFVMTSVKIFFMDLWRLGSLYRVASFIGLAAVLILVSFLYQKFLATAKKK